MEITKEDVTAILNKLDDIDKDVTDLKLMSLETAGQSKGNIELVKLEIEHMKIEHGLREEKLVAQLALVNTEVQRNKESIKELFENDKQQETINTKITILFGSLILIAPAVGYLLVQLIRLWGKVEGMG